MSIEHCKQGENRNNIMADHPSTTPCTFINHDYYQVYKCIENYTAIVIFCCLRVFINLKVTFLFHQQIVFCLMGKPVKMERGILYIYHATLLEESSIWNITLQKKRKKVIIISKVNTQKYKHQDIVFRGCQELSKSFDNTQFL